MLLQSSTLFDLAAWVAVASVKGTVLIGAVTSFRGLLDLATTSTWRHALWLPMLACLICPLGPDVPLISALPSSLPASLAALNPEGSPAGIHGSLDSRAQQMTARTDAQIAPSAPIERNPAPSPAVSVNGARSGALLFWLVLIWMAGVTALDSLYLGNLL